MKIKVGILGAAEIAKRRFLPALLKNNKYEFVGIASRDLQNAIKITNEFGGKAYESYMDLLNDSSIDVVYIPLPPTLHHKWAKIALNKNKNVFIEKPMTISYSQTEELLEIAQEKDLCVYENYMFLYHRQIEKIEELIKTNEIGNINLYKMSFGFPFRGNNDFRYSKELGGGATLECGGYPVRFSLELLGNSISLETSNLVMSEEYDVDIFGSASLKNDKGIVSQISFGMDNEYKCSFEAWGSKGSIVSERIFTPGPDFRPEIIITKGGTKRIIEIEPDDHFYNSLEYFYKIYNSNIERKKNNSLILKQSTIINEMLEQIQ